MTVRTQRSTGVRAPARKLLPSTSRVTGPYNTLSECDDRECTYYVHYLRRGAADLTHEDYHLKERLHNILNDALADAGEDAWRRRGIERQITVVEAVLRV